MAMIRLISTICIQPSIRPVISVFTPDCPYQCPRMLLYLVAKT